MACAIVLAYVRPGPWATPPVTADTRPGGPSQTVFVYGTLRYSAVRWLVMGASGQPQADAITGFYAQGLDLHPAADQRTAGLRLDISAAQLARLDQYERLGQRYWRGIYTLESGETAWIYRRYRDGSLGQREPVAPRRVSPAH